MHCRVDPESEIGVIRDEKIFNATTIAHAHPSIQQPLQSFCNIMSMDSSVTGKSKAGKPQAEQTTCNVNKIARHLRTRPLSKLSADEYVICDPIAYVEAATQGPYFLMMSKKRQAYSLEWGKGFESYCFAQITSMIKSGGIRDVEAYPGPLDSNDEEICDIAILYENTSILIQCKAVFLNEDIFGVSSRASSGELCEAIRLKYSRELHGIAYQNARWHVRVARGECRLPWSNGLPKTPISVALVFDKTMTEGVFAKLFYEEFQCRIREITEKYTDAAFNTLPRLAMLSIDTLEQMHRSVSSRDFFRLLLKWSHFPVHESINFEDYLHSNGAVDQYPNHYIADRATQLILDLKTRVMPER